jgi:hypothetical protein
MRPPWTSPGAGFSELAEAFAGQPRLPKLPFRPIIRCNRYSSPNFTKKDFEK